MKNLIRPAAALLLALVLCAGSPGLAQAAPVSPSYFNLCANPITRWLCPR
jgi:hypothetical protein